MERRFELTAAAAEDPQLGEHLRSESAGSRASILADADRLASGNETQRHLAALVLCELHGDIDPATPVGARRAAWFVKSSRWVDARAAALLRRIAESHPDADVRARAAALAVRIADDAGDAAAATRGFRIATARAPGGAAALDLSDIAIRHEACAIALSECDRAIAECSDVPRIVFLARRIRADAFAVLGDAVRCERELHLADPWIPRLGSEDARIARADCAAVRMRLHLVRNEPAIALRNLLPAFDDGGAAGPARTCDLHVGGARALLALGRNGDAAAHVARAIRSGVADARLELEIEMLEVRLQHVAGGIASARQRAAELVTRLSGTARRTFGPLRRAKVATQLAMMLAEPSGDVHAALRAWDLCASSVLEALGRRDAVASLSEDDAAALREHRQRQEAERANVTTSVARFLESAARRHGTSILAGRDSGPGHITFCPWCARARYGEGAWSPDEDVRGTADVVEVIHGACDDCASALVRKLATQPVR